MLSTDSYWSRTCWSSRVLRSGTEISWPGVEVPDTLSDPRVRLPAEGAKAAPGAPEGNLDARTLPSKPPHPGGAGCALLVDRQPLNLASPTANTPRGLWVGVEGGSRR